jgi:hypothetical protein
MTWTITSSGWARFTWTADDFELQVSTSYLDKGLKGLLRAARDLQLGSSATNAGVYDMPNGYMFLFGGAGEQVYMQILDMPDHGQDDPWVGVTRVWGDRISVTGFIDATIRMAQEVLDEHGEDGYSALWRGGPFPMEDLAALKSGV